jgi:hypothetical protein
MDVSVSYLAAERALEKLIVALCIPLLLWIGYKLFVLGAKGEIQLSAKTSSVSGKLTNLSPGVFCFLAATGLAAWVHWHTFVIEPIVGDAAGDHNSASRRVVAMGGSGALGLAPPSVLVRRVLSQWYLCQELPSDNRDNCMKRVTPTLKRQPTIEELESEQQDEAKAASGDAQAQARVVTFRRNFLE